jgi:hypothetical protein
MLDSQKTQLFYYYYYYIYKIYRAELIIAEHLDYITPVHNGP